MIRTLKRLVATDGGDNKEYIEIACNSADTKPTAEIITGSKAKEVDTGKEFRFDEAGETWIEQP